ncbi:MAG: HAD family hydrolase [Lachnospiraceae bacterium]
MKKTIIWDLDGTLLNTVEDLADAVNFVEQKYGNPKKTEEEIKSFLGYGYEKLIEDATPQGKENPDFAAIFSEFQTYYTQHCNVKTDLYAGMKNVILALKEAGFCQAVVTNKNQIAAKELAEVYFPQIPVVVGQQDGMRKKPAPDMVEAALEKLCSSKEDAVYIGDSEVDVQTAGNSGLTGIAVTWGFRSKEELIKAGAKTLVHTPEELLAHLTTQSL